MEVASRSFSAPNVLSLLERFTESQGCYENELAEVGSQVLKDIFGNPFRPTILVPVWVNTMVLNLAQDIFDGRIFDCLPLLADSLEDAGCTNADIMNHCRSPGPHVRGCWVVDAVLGKE